jgi:ubiquinone/menaquinone biosynthesis C-methylase UbiE
MENTGERFLPWDDDPVVCYEHIHRYRFAQELVKGKKVLDLACGEGYGSFMLAEDARSVTGLDIDGECVKHASAKYLRENLEFIEGSVTEVPLGGKGIFDVIVCFEALEHMEEHDKLMKEARRLLKKTGIFIASTPNKHIYSDRPAYKNLFHLKELYFDEFKGLLDDNFKNSIIYGQKVYPSSTIFSLFKSPATTRDYVVEKGDGGFLFAPPEKRGARYFISVSSDGPLKELTDASYLVDVSETLFKHKDARIKNVVKEIKTVIGDRDAKIKELDTAIGHRRQGCQDKRARYGHRRQGCQYKRTRHGRKEE